MKKLTSFLVIFCIATACCVFSAAEMPQQQGRTIVLPDGTEISAVTTDTLSSKTSHEDDQITFKVDEDVMIDGGVVVAKGTAIKGVVSNAKKSGYFGRGGQLNVRVESTVGVDGQKVKVGGLKRKRRKRQDRDDRGVGRFVRAYWLSQERQKCGNKSRHENKGFHRRGKILSSRRSTTGRS